MFHVCQEKGRRDSLLCPNGTIFDAQFIVCNWWYSVNCTAQAILSGTLTTSQVISTTPLPISFPDESVDITNLTAHNIGPDAVELIHFQTPAADLAINGERDLLNIEIASNSSLTLSEATDSLGVVQSINAVPNITTGLLSDVAEPAASVLEEAAHNVTSDSHVELPIDADHPSASQLAGVSELFSDAVGLFFSLPENVDELSPQIVDSFTSTNTPPNTVGQSVSDVTPIPEASASPNDVKLATDRSMEDISHSPVPPNNAVELLFETTSLSIIHPSPVLSASLPQTATGPFLEIVSPSSGSTGSTFSPESTSSIDGLLDISDPDIVDLSVNAIDPLKKSPETFSDTVPQNVSVVSSSEVTFPPNDTQSPIHVTGRPNESISDQSVDVQQFLPDIADALPESLLPLHDIDSLFGVVDPPTTTVKTLHIIFASSDYDSLPEANGEPTVSTPEHDIRGPLLNVVESPSEVPDSSSNMTSFDFTESSITTVSSMADDMGQPIPATSDSFTNNNQTLIAMIDIADLTSVTTKPTPDVSESLLSVVDFSTEPFDSLPVLIESSPNASKSSVNVDETQSNDADSSLGTTETSGNILDESTNTERPCDSAKPCTEKMLQILIIPRF